eukprot:gene962-1044_t
MTLKPAAGLASFACNTRIKIRTQSLFLLFTALALSTKSLAMSSSSSSHQHDVFTQRRLNMVTHQIQARGITDESVLKAMREVPRHLFVPPALEDAAYRDHALPIGNDQTISQPFIVAAMADCALIKRSDKVLEIGTGCGYSAAVLSRLAGEVHTVETIAALHHEATDRLRRLGYQNVHCYLGDGSMGLAEMSPYDVIIVTAGAPAIPPSLQAQLNLGGRLVIPVRRGGLGEDLLRVTREAGHEFVEEKLMDVSFVPLIGQEGWQQQHSPRRSPPPDNNK